MDDMVIAYHDCVLRVRDVALLTGPHWLNDAVMSFYFEYLREEENARCANLNASARDGQPRRRDVVFVDATVSFLVANVCATEAGSILEQTGVNRAKHVLFLVSDNDDVRHAGGGSHWSLLLYVAPDAPGALDGGTFEHFDSMHGRNDEKAFALAGTLAAANALPGCRDVSVGGSFTKHHDVAQQRNGYDCGIFALATAETCVRVFTAEKIQKNSLASIVAEDVSQETVRDMRGELLRLVERLTEENT